MPKNSHVVSNVEATTESRSLLCTSQSTRKEMRMPLFQSSLEPGVIMALTFPDSSLGLLGKEIPELG